MRRLVWAIGLLGAAALIAATVVVYQRLEAPFKGYLGSEQFVDIPAGTSTRGIAERLATAGVVPDRWTFRLALWWTGDARHLKAGEYRFDRPVTPADVIGKLARGDVYVIYLTFPEGLTITEMAAIVEGAGFGPASSFIDAAKNVSLVRAFDSGAPDLEGYLFPDTYGLSRHADAPQIVRAMVARFEQVFTPSLRAAAEAQGLSVRQAVTFASLVEKETAKAEERPIVAAVYENRFQRGMALQCDPTVIYALERAGRYTGRLGRDDLAFDSPYNTYHQVGLPPGPIASPGRASLEAAIHPAATDYLYFVSRNDGTHEFSRTLAEHSRNVQKYQIDYFRDKKSH